MIDDSVRRIFVNRGVFKLHAGRDATPALKKSLSGGGGAWTPTLFPSS